MSDLVSINAGRFAFVARLEEERAPRTSAVLRSLLPYRAKILQARWSGFAAWVPLDLGPALDLPPENATTIPLPGQLLLYPGGISEVEILFPYGATYFASVAGPLAGNHVLTVVDGSEQFEELGRTVQWEGAQDVAFELLER